MEEEGKCKVLFSPVTLAPLAIVNKNEAGSNEPSSSHTKRNQQRKAHINDEKTFFKLLFMQIMVWAEGHEIQLKSSIQWSWDALAMGQKSISYLYIEFRRKELPNENRKIERQEDDIISAPPDLSRLFLLHIRTNKSDRRLDENPGSSVI